MFTLTIQYSSNFQSCNFYPRKRNCVSSGDDLEKKTRIPFELWIETADLLLSGKYFLVMLGYKAKFSLLFCSKLCQGCFCIIFLQMTTPRRGQSPSTGTYPLRIWESSQRVTPKIDIRMHVLRSETDGKDLQTSDWRFPTLFYLIVAYFNDWTLTFYTWIYLQ